ncbi:MAG: hypothetical protein JO287_15500 [Pseudonocardiales bacterium]|nr:hypothetical protein [Pseudonocardiales bacterium]
MPLFIPLLIGALSIAGAAALLWWKKILNWAEDHLKPWISANMPYLLQYLDDAFVALDNVAVELRKAAKNAWQQLRQVLIKQVAEFDRQNDGNWTLRITSWLATKNSAQTVIKKETEQLLSWDDLPGEVREQYFRQHQTSREIDITKLRDEQVLTNDA